MRSFIARINAPEGRRRRAMSASGYFRHGRDRGEKDAARERVRTLPRVKACAIGEPSKKLCKAFSYFSV